MAELVIIFYFEFWPQTPTFKGGVVAEDGLPPAMWALSVLAWTFVQLF